MRALVLAAATALTLAACGGGGSDDSLRAAEGAYQGTISLGYTFESIVLENSEFWAVYGMRTAGGLAPYGLVHGTSAPANGVLISTDVKDFVYTGAIDTGKLEASYVPGVSFKGSALLSGQSLSFNTTPTSPAEFDYDQVPNLASFAGKWSGVTIYGQSATIAITETGVMSGTIGGCAVSGTLSVRERGKNVLASKISLRGASCETPIEGTGIAVMSKPAGSAAELRVSALNANETAALTFVAQR